MAGKIKITKVEDPNKQEEKPKSKVYHRFTIFAVLGIFLLPLLLAWFLYLNSDKWQPATTNKGQLIQPSVSINDLDMRTQNNLPLSINSFNGRWILMYLNANECTKSCIDNLRTINQVRLALGKNGSKVSPLFITAYKNENDPLEAMLFEQFPVIQFGLVSTEVLDDLSSKLPTNARPGNDGKLYIVDPQGSIMMSYDVNTDPNGVLKDLKRLTK